MLRATCNEIPIDILVIEPERHGLGKEHIYLLIYIFMYLFIYLFTSLWFI